MPRQPRNARSETARQPNWRKKPLSAAVAQALSARVGKLPDLPHNAHDALFAMMLDHPAVASDTAFWLLWQAAPK